jgi:hypothetical protein
MSRVYDSVTGSNHDARTAAAGMARAVESASRRLVTRVYLEHVALRAVEPGNDDELIAPGNALKRGCVSRRDFEPRAGRSFRTLARRCSSLTAPALSPLVGFAEEIRRADHLGNFHFEVLVPLLAR